MKIVVALFYRQIQKVMFKDFKIKFNLKAQNNLCKNQIVGILFKERQLCLVKLIKKLTLI